MPPTPMNPPPLPTTASPPPTKSHRIRLGKLHRLFAVPGTLLTIIGLTLLFDTNGSERGIETSLGLLILIIAGLFLTAAFIAWLLRPYHCANCQTKLHRRALSCSNCTSKTSNLNRQDRKETNRHRKQSHENDLPHQSNPHAHASIKHRQTDFVARLRNGLPRVGAAT